MISPGRKIWAMAQTQGMVCSLPILPRKSKAMAVLNIGRNSRHWKKCWKRSSVVTALMNGRCFPLFFMDLYTAGACSFDGVVPVSKKILVLPDELTAVFILWDYVAGTGSAGTLFIPHYGNAAGTCGIFLE